MLAPYDLSGQICYLFGVVSAKYLTTQLANWQDVLGIEQVVPNTWHPLLVVPGTWYNVLGTKSFQRLSYDNHMHNLAHTHNCHTLATPTNTPSRIA